MAEGKDAALAEAEVIVLIRKHATELADVAQRHGLETLSYFLFMAAKQAEKDLRAFGAYNDGTTSQ